MNADYTLVSAMLSLIMLGTITSATNSPENQIRVQKCVGEQIKIDCPYTQSCSIDVGASFTVFSKDRSKQNCLDNTDSSRDICYDVTKYPRELCYGKQSCEFLARDTVEYGKCEGKAYNLGMSYRCICTDCKTGTWGIGCANECHCTNNAKCDAETGKCPNGCKDWYFTDSCSVFVDVPSLRDVRLSITDSDDVSVTVRFKVHEQSSYTSKFIVYIPEIKEDGTEEFVAQRGKAIKHEDLNGGEAEFLIDGLSNKDYVIRIVPFRVDVEKAIMQAGIASFPITYARDQDIVDIYAWTNDLDRRVEKVQIGETVHIDCVMAKTIKPNVAVLMMHGEQQLNCDVVKEMNHICRMTFEVSKDHYAEHGWQCEALTDDKKITSQYLYLDPTTGDDHYHALYDGKKTVAIGGDKDGPSTATMVGSSLGALMFIACVIVSAWYCKRRQDQEKKEEDKEAIETDGSMSLDDFQNSSMEHDNDRHSSKRHGHDDRYGHDHRHDRDHRHGYEHRRDHDDRHGHGHGHDRDDKYGHDSIDRHGHGPKRNQDNKHKQDAKQVHDTLQNKDKKQDNDKKPEKVEIRDVSPKAKRTSDSPPQVSQPKQEDRKLDEIIHEDPIEEEQTKDHEDQSNQDLRRQNFAGKKRFQPQPKTEDRKPDQRKHYNQIVNKLGQNIDSQDHPRTDVQAGSSVQKQHLPEQNKPFRLFEERFQNQPRKNQQSLDSAAGQSKPSGNADDHSRPGTLQEYDTDEMETTMDEGDGNEEEEEQEEQEEHVEVGSQEFQTTLAESQDLESMTSRRSSLESNRRHRRDSRRSSQDIEAGERRGIPRPLPRRETPEPRNASDRRDSINRHEMRHERRHERTRQNDRRPDYGKRTDSR